MKTHIVYMVQARTMGLVKIGCTGNFIRRLKILRTDSPDELVLLWRSRPMTQHEALGAERYLHNKFQAFHVNREWYSLEPEILSFIKDMTLSDSLVNAPSDICFLETLSEPVIPKINTETVPDLSSIRRPFRRHTIKTKCSKLTRNKFLAAQEKIKERQKQLENEKEK